MASLDHSGRHNHAGIVAALAALVSLFTTAWFLRNGDMLLYGDAVAHINIARRLVDCMQPGYRQLGSVWLPLPHLLIAPFVQFDGLWRSGLGGSFASMAAYVLGTVGIYRLLAMRVSQLAAWVAACVYALNPSMLYMQATAMNEPLFLAEMIWALVYLSELELALKSRRDGMQWLELKPPVLLRRCAYVLVAAIFTRYDGWFFAAACGVLVLWLLVRYWRFQDERKPLLRSTVSFFLLCALAPALWLAYNYNINGKALDFINGPYSAKGIAERSTAPGAPPYPGKDHPGTAALYLMKAAEYNMAEGWPQLFVLGAALVGTIVAVRFVQGGWSLLLLWIPLPFYALSIAYGSVPIFIPAWWPHSYYNVRYGLELLPMFAVFLGVLAFWLKGLPKRAWQSVAAMSVVLLLVGGAYATSWKATPICLREARVNGQARITLRNALARFVQRMPPNAILLMRTGEHVGVLQEAGFHLKRVIWEGVYEKWDAALYDPAANADYVLAFEGDEVDRAVKVHNRGLESIVVIHVPGQARATLYRSLVRGAPGI